MTVLTMDRDLDNRTLTVTCQFAASPDRVWQLWADPRQLERWWGPPGYPATFTEHDLRPGGAAAYYMTSPEGERYHGYWRFSDVAATTRLAFTDGFADDEGRPDPDLPVSTTEVTLADHDGGTRMVITSGWETVELMQQTLDMGVEEGLREALGQIDAVLAG